MASTEGSYTPEGAPEPSTKAEGVPPADVWHDRAWDGAIGPATGAGDTGAPAPSSGGGAADPLDGWEERRGERRGQRALPGTTHLEYRLHGCPGGGKSTALATRWIPDAVQRFSSEGVTVCSLTRAAAAEIASRDSGLPRERIGTLHGLCYRALGQPTLAEKAVQEWNEAYPMYRLSGGGSKGGLDDPLDPVRNGPPTQGDEIASRAEILRHRRVPRARWPDAVAKYQAARDAWMQREGYVDFTGLIEQALLDVPQAPGDPCVLIVDEAQDSSALELAVVRAWAEASEYLVLAGDSDQSIYEWRGSTPDAFVRPEIAPDHNYHLRQSWRVPRAVHACAESWMRQVSSRYVINSLPRDHDGALVLGRDLSLSSSATHRMIARVQRYVDDGKTVMVLASCGYHLQYLIRALRENAIAFHNPYRPHAGKWNPLAGPAWRLRAFLQPLHRQLLNRDTPRLWTWRELNAWSSIVCSRGTLLRGAKKVITENFRRDEREQVPREKLPELFEAAALADLQDAVKRSRGDKPEDQLAMVEWLASRLTTKTLAAVSMKFTLRLVRKRGVRMLVDAPRVIVGTIHSVKGGEADVVFLAPDLSPTGYAGWLARATKKAAADGTVRMFYVGMTRARESLVLLNQSTSTAVKWRL